MTHKHLAPTRVGLALAVVVGAVFGAIFGQPGSGRAAVTAAPKNTAPPTISGVAEVGSTLTANPGTWTNSPTSYSYTWKRCDASGNACAAIANASGKFYTVTGLDQGHTIRVTVKATNADGSASATSAPTAYIPASGCPTGGGPIPIADLNPPAQLMIDEGSISPSVVTPTTSAVDIRFTVTACSGRPVVGATVFAAAVPFNQFAATSGATGADGTVELHETALRGFPVSHRQHLLVLFARATKPGEPLLDGVSTRRLVSFPVRSG
jgi:hypothetical protein